MDTYKKRRSIIVFTELLLLMTQIYAAKSELSAETRLVKYLFGNEYDSGVTPVCENHSRRINVTLDLSLHQIVDLDEPMQIITLNLWTRLNWRDCRLMWDESQFGNINHIILPLDRVWVPDITLYDSVHKETRSTDLYKVDINSNGLVRYHSPSLTESKCEMDVKYFPFDKQTCALIFGSWMYNADRLALENKQDDDLTALNENIEWSILKFSAENEIKQFSCCKTPYTIVTFKLTLQRKPDYYVYHILAPCILISTMGTLGFVLPVEAGEKISVGITVLLSLTVFLLVIEEKLPPSSDTLPMIAIYFQFAMFLICFECAVTVIVVNLHHKSSLDEVPSWVKSVFLVFLAKWIFLHKKKKTAVKEKIQEQSRGGDNHLPNTELPHIQEKEVGPPPSYSRELQEKTNKGNGIQNSYFDEKNSVTEWNLIAPVQRGKDDGIQCISYSKYKESGFHGETENADLPPVYSKESTQDECPLRTEKSDSIAQNSVTRPIHGITEWQLVAAVLDRVGLVLYFVSFLLGTIVFLNLFLNE